ncbi:putative disease resistance protein At3g14460 [Cannabis sativa]|uniref:putative disease resistance protein At3g14460 n=1 Tax=Cannabis sativa TaxID=3483 RepID=UPI0029CA1D2C|nr:putative disease resistance protein At3g14460 [Cannabis sativa]
MALELLVAPVVSASVDLLVKKIASSDLVGSFLRGKTDSGFDKLLDKLETTFLSLAEVLSDAEQKQFRNSRVEKWLDKLQDVVEDAEDLFDEIEYDALKLKVETESEFDDKFKVSKLSSIFNSIDRKRKTDMEKILERLNTFKEERYILDLRTNVEKIQSQRTPSMSSIDDAEFFGRDEEKKILKEVLVENEVGKEKICVIPIVGLGGIGKTTLAQAVYNDDEVEKYFQLKAWVCVSDEFDVCKVMKTVLEAVTKSSCNVEGLSVLEEKIQQVLDKKKFLIVLDDIWNEEHDFWNTLRMLFRVGAQGSKIIVTTRSEKVASIVGTVRFQHLDVLKEEACFQLFVKIVSGNENFTTTDSHLGRIGKEVVKKCKGLPLAVKAIASLLRFTHVKEWKRIAKSDILDLQVGEKNILPALRLSYHYLPSHLKRCFIYCSMFPKDHQFYREELVLLWMVDSLLEHSSGNRRNRTVKEVGNEYFDELVSRSFFQPIGGRSKRYGTGVFETVNCFVMHDLMVDLANFVSKKKILYLEKDKMYDIGIVKQLRHVGFDMVNCQNLHEIYKLVSDATCLRTIMPVTRNLFATERLQEDVSKDIRKLKRLRFLSLAGYMNVNELGVKSIGELRHLRHLDFSYTSIKELPESVCLLYNLQSLQLFGCKLLTKFPKKFHHHLINLRYLYMSCVKICTLPPLGQLPALLALSIERCDAVEMVGVEFYGTSSSQSFPLLESLTFRFMENWKEWSTPKANVEAFPKLKELYIESCQRLTGDLPGLLPSLTNLEICDCPELASPLPMMPLVTRIRIDRCEKIARFKSLSSLQSYDDLEDLYLGVCSFKLLPLHSFSNIRHVEVYDCENLESFSLTNTLNSLSFLYIRYCPNFTLFPDSNLHCPILTQLWLVSCEKLKFLPEKLPSLLPSLQELAIYGCPELESLPKCGLPFSLRMLTISNCNKLIASRKNWKLQTLPNLTFFRIEDYQCEDMESLLEQGMLPPSITSLEIVKVACLKSLDHKGFQEIESLKELYISECPKLQSLPVKGLPPAFEGLLPPSFETFFMNYCPLLEEKYEWEYNSDNHKGWMMIRCITRPQDVSSQQPLIKPFLRLIGPKAVVLHILLILLCMYLYAYFNL